MGWIIPSGPGISVAFKPIAAYHLAKATQIEGGQRHFHSSQDRLANSFSSNCLKAIVMQAKSPAHLKTLPGTNAQGSMFPFLLEYKKVCTLLSVAFYILVLFLLYPIIGRIALMFSVVPAMVVGWGYGLRGGLVAGLLSILLNTLLLNLTGNEPGGWAALVTPEGGGLGSLVVVLVGMAIGKMSDFNRQLQQEIQYRKQTEEELAKSQESLELRVAERTEELSKQQEMLFETQSLAKFGTIRRDLQTGEGWWSDEVYRILGGVRQKQAPTFEDLLEQCSSLRCGVGQRDEHQGKKDWTL